MKNFFMISMMLSLFGLSSILLKAQTTLTLQPDGTTGKDAMLHGTPGYMDNNYGTDPELPASAWTFGGTAGVIRSVIEFDLTAIPVNATITSAKLSLYATNDLNSMGQHSTLSGPNDCWLERITSDWNESNVTWNTQPTTTTQNHVSLPASDSATENYLDIDVTTLTQDMVNNPSTSFGFMLKLQNESYYRRMNFCSSDNTTPSLRPKLVITFTTSPLPADSCITMQPDATKGKDAMLHGTSGYMDNNYGTDPEFPAAAWTFSGVPGIIRSVIEFDLNTIPSNATVTSAKLSLYAIDNNLSMGQHSTLSGPNDCLLQRITSAWNQYTVTWNTQPTTTTQNEVALPASDSATENYLNIDVTAITQDMVNNPSSSFGFMFKLQNESYYRRMNFCSSDNTNPALRPKLEVCYSTSNGVHEQLLTNNNISIYPNPAKDNITIETNSNTEQRLEIVNLIGQTVYTNIINRKAAINTSAFANGVYFLKLYTDKETVVKKFVKE